MEGCCFLNVSMSHFMLSVDRNGVLIIKNELISLAMAVLMQEPQANLFGWWCAEN
jgi:hypothetical protein